MGTLACRTCGIGLEGQGRGYKYCEAHRVSYAERRARAQREGRKRRRERTAPACCSVCGAAFLAARSDAKTCSAACKRVLANRKARAFEGRNRGHCLDCGTETARRSTRCKLCSEKVAGKHPSGELNSHWKGGRSMSRGYVYILVAPEARKGHRYRAEHILVWETAKGPLPEGYVVHHLNGIKDDNRLENLEAMPRKKHNHRHDEHDRRIFELEAEVARLRGLLK